MKILILYDRTAIDDNGNNWLLPLLEKFSSADNVESIMLNHNELKYCTGCFGCWIKTPGMCVIKNDSANEISKKYINADKVILLTRVTYGGYSADTKAFLDRSIVNLSPFFIKKNGEMHHRRRYKKYPDLILCGYGSITDSERKTFLKLSERNALNLHPEKNVTILLDDENETIKNIKF